MYSKQDLLELFKQLINVMENNNIWYALDCGSLLGAIRHKGMIPWDDDIDLVITVESYRKLKKLFPNNVVDGENEDFPLVMPKWVADKSKILENVPAIDMFVIINTKLSLVEKKYCSFKTRFIYGTQAVQTTWIPFDMPTKILKIVTRPFKKYALNRKVTTDTIIKMLETDEPDGYYTIDNPTIQPLKLWMKNYSFETEKKEFEGMMVNVPIEWDEILKRKYTSNYMTPRQDVNAFEHINVISVKKKKNVK